MTFPFRYSIFILGSVACFGLACRDQAATVRPVTAPKLGTQQSGGATVTEMKTVPVQRQNPFVVRPFKPLAGGEPIETGVAYSPYRDGQRPGAADLPTRQQIKEDLQIIVRHWRLLRLYGCIENAETILQIIRQEKIPISVLLGAWIAGEELYNEKKEFVRINEATMGSNGREVRAAIRLGQEFPDIVVGLSVGSETQVDWSSYRVNPERLIQYIRMARAATNLPVATADDFTFWNTSASQAIAAETDFVLAHIYAMWHGQQPAAALDFTITQYEQIRRAHPEREIVVGEVGWATNMQRSGLQAERMKGNAGEAEQASFFTALDGWARSARVVTFYFEAFDENWKGGLDPDDAEKHWGLYYSNRTPKPAILSADSSIRLPGK